MSTSTNPFGLLYYNAGLGQYTTTVPTPTSNSAGPIFSVVTKPFVVPYLSYVPLNQDIITTTATNVFGYSWTPSTSNVVLNQWGAVATVVPVFGNAGLISGSTNGSLDITSNSWTKFRLYVSGHQQDVPSVSVGTTANTSFQLGYGKFVSPGVENTLTSLFASNTTITCVDYGYMRGPTYNASDWYSLPITDVPCVYLKNATNSSNGYNITSMHIQYSS